MRSRISKVLLGFGFAFAVASSAHAQATRTWVSGVGDDFNPCSRTAPCKTFAGAISKTADGGFINVLDPGAFGAVTITKAITIDGDAQHAGVLATFGSNAIVINAPGKRVTLRNLTLESPSVTNPGLNGIRVIAATEVHVENVWIGNFSNRAVDWTAAAGGEGYFNDVTTVNNGGTSGDGMVFESGRIMINRLRAESNRGSAVQSQNSAIVTVRDSYAAGNTAGFAAAVNNTAILNVENCTATGNTHGIFASGGSTVRVSNSVIVSNVTNGLFNDGISTIISMSGNALTGNPNNGVFNGVTVNKQ